MSREIRKKEHPLKKYTVDAKDGQLLLHEFGFWLLADWAGITVRKFFERNRFVVYIATDAAHPGGVRRDGCPRVFFRQIGRCVFGALSLDDFMVVSVCHGRRGAMNVAVYDFSKEYRVGRGFHFVDDFTDDVATGVCKDGKPFPCFKKNVLEFIYVSAGLKTESSNQRRIRCLRQDGDGKFPGLFNAGVGKVVMVHAKRKGCRRRSDLHHTVCGAAGRAFPVEGRDNVDAVG